MDTTRIRFAVASEGRSGLDEQVGQHFGRCPAYTLVDVRDGRVGDLRVVDNPFATGHGPGDVPGFIAGTEANVLLTGGIGQRAISFFDRHGIAVASGYTGTVGEAVEAWIAGEVGGAQPCSGHGLDPGDAHHGHGGCGRSP